jgi:Holliday junction resolvasome RuvABC endonuclease subunit
VSVKATVVGLDLSMTATGLAHTVSGSACWHLVKPKLAKDRRLGEIKDRVRQYVDGADFVLVEMLPPNMKGAGITGMVQGVIRQMLIERGIPYGDIGPSSLKKYATGRGNASKTEMSLAAMKRAGVELAEDNLCDAWWLWVMANDHLGQPVFSLPQLQRGELGKIEMKG